MPRRTKRELQDVPKRSPIRHGASRGGFGLSPSEAPPESRNRLGRQAVQQVDNIDKHRYDSHRYENASADQLLRTAQRGGNRRGLQGALGPRASEDRQPARLQRGAGL